ncbi:MULTISPECIES: M15 family metallopeptidase [unclassified Treponema]|uniref:M15 family metallopeptidase n=1 Tax=unclassified Treponema TaxID=2638727 RepID=UPI0025EE9A5A|nr:MULTISPECIES: M15 family metallopeptidase [unclassified Treponema]
MKKSVFSSLCAILLFFCGIFVSCGQKKNKPAATENLQAQNPELAKLNRVLSSMSERAKNVIPNGNPEEFLADLHRVLESRKNFSSEDLSPFYLIDKRHAVGADYEPKNLVHLEKNDLFAINKNNLSLRPESFEALKVLAQAAKNDGITLTVSSTYRSYEYQKNLFAYWVKVDGLEEAERESAREGTSQHQLGMALDFAPVDDAFADTVPGQWVYKNAAKYGWSLSFPNGYEDITGYRWESWHFRYIGVEACEFQKKWFGDVQQFMMEFLDAWEDN